MSDPSPTTREEKARTPIRVAQVVFSLEPGGMENGVVNLANELPREEVETRVWCLERAGGFAERLSEGVRVEALGRKPGWDWRACWRLGRGLRRERPDVIHTHNLGPLIYAVVARGLVPSLWRVPILHGEHGALQGDGLRGKRLRQRRWLYRCCRRVHTVSEGLRRHLMALGMPEAGLVSVLNGVDCERFQPVTDKGEARVRVGLPRDAEVSGSVGRFIATKRFPLLVEAFERLAEKRPKLVLMILGDGGEAREEVLQRVASSGVRDRIYLKGHQSEPAPFYQAMDLMVMPSSHEGLANALLESMACGVPVLAHAACGASEVVRDGETGYLREIESGEGLAGMIETIWGGEVELEVVGRAARAAAVGELSIERMVGSYLKLYRECVMGRG